MHRAVAEIDDAGLVVFDFSITGGAGGIGRCGIGAQSEPRVGRAVGFVGNGWKCEDHRAVCRTVGNGDARTFSRVVEHAVGVVVDPAIERGCAAGVVGDSNAHCWRRTFGQE